MPVSRITLDGLWRCLCPSINVIAIFTQKFPLRANSFCSIPRNRALTRSGSQWKVSAHCLHSEVQPAVQLLERIKDAKDSSRYSKFIQPSKLPPHVTFDQLTISELHDSLRHLDAEDGVYKKITSIVNHLVSKRGEKPSLLHYDALIRANADPNHGSAGIVANLLAEMKDTGIVVDSGVYHSALQALANHPDFILRNQILRDMKARWFTLTSEGWHSVAVGQLREHQYEMALNTLQAMRKQQIQVEPWLYDIFVYIFCEADELDEALKILRYREEFGGMDTSPYIWHYALDAFSLNYHYEGTLYAWRKRVETGYINPSDGMCINVMNTAARNHDPTLATDVSRVLADRASKLDIHQYEALIEAYAGSTDVKGALHVLSIMKKAGLEPGEATTRPIYTELQKWPSAPLHAWELLESLHKDGKLIPIAAINVVLEAYIFHGDLTEALGQFKSLKKICRTGPSTATFNALLQGCSKGEGTKGTALSLASEMVKCGVRPDIVTYDHLIVTCLADDDYEDAFSYLQEMMAKFGLGELRMETWNALIKKCVGAADGRAWDILEEMKEQGIETDTLICWVAQEWKKLVG